MPCSLNSQRMKSRRVGTARAGPIAVRSPPGVRIVRTTATHASILLASRAMHVQGYITVNKSLFALAMQR